MWRSSGKKMSASKAVTITEEPGEDGVNAWTDVNKGDRLSDLMDDVWDCRDQAENERAKIESRPASSPNTKSEEGGDRNTGNAVAVKILRPNIVVTQQVKLEK